MYQLRQTCKVIDQVLEDKDIMVRKSIFDYLVRECGEDGHCSYGGAINSYSVIQKLEDKLKVAHVHLSEPVGMYIEELPLPVPFFWDSCYIPLGSFSKLTTADPVKTIKDEFGINIKDYL